MQVDSLIILKFFNRCVEDGVKAVFLNPILPVTDAVHDQTRSQVAQVDRDVCVNIFHVTISGGAGALFEIRAQ